MKSLFFILITSIFLQGCATYNVQSTHLDASKPLVQDHGVVALQIVNNTGRLAPLHSGWTEVFAVRMDNYEQLKQAAIDKARIKAETKNKPFDPDEVDWEPEIYSFTPNPQGVIDSQLFVGSMPEGEYVVSSLHSFYTDGNMSSWLNMPVFNSAGQFNVEAGKFTNLGSIVFQPLLNIKDTSFWSNSSSRKAFVTRIDETENLQDFITEHYPNLRSSVDFSQPLTWNEDVYNAIRIKLSRLSRKNAFGSRAIMLDKNGNRAILAKFGQLHLVNSAGNWQQIDLPTNGQLASVFYLKDKVLVGSERGLVFVSDKIESGWQVTQPVPAREAVIWFGMAGEQLYALTASAKNHQVYHIDPVDLSWRQVGQFERKNPNDYWVQNGGLFPIVTNEGGLRILNDNKLFDLNPESGKWTSVRSSPMVQIEQLSTGVLVGLEVSQWDGVGDQVVSFDYGETWNSLSRNLKLFGDHGTDRSLPIVLEDSTVVSLGRANKSVKQLQIISALATEDFSRKSWTMRGLARKDCQIALPQLTHQQRIYFLCDQGQVVSTADFGTSWRTEVSMDIGAMQQEYERMLTAFAEENKKQQEAD